MAILLHNGGGLESNLSPGPSHGVAKGVGIGSRDDGGEEGVVPKALQVTIRPGSGDIRHSVILPFFLPPLFSIRLPLY